MESVSSNESLLAQYRELRGKQFEAKTKDDAEGFRKEADKLWIQIPKEEQRAYWAKFRVLNTPLASSEQLKFFRLSKAWIQNTQ